MEDVIKLMVAMPCYQGVCHVLCAKQLLKLQNLLQSKNIEMELFTLESESLIFKSRNVCASAFLKSNCSHLMFIDSDILFNPSDVVKLLNHKRNHNRSLSC